MYGLICLLVFLALGGLPSIGGAAVEAAQTEAQERVSLEFENAEVRHVLQAIARLARINIALSKGVQGRLNIHLQDIPWPQALKAILQSQNLVQTTFGNVIAIRTSAEAHNDVQADDLQTRSFDLNYAKASDVERQLKQLKGNSEKGTSSFLGQGGTIFAEPRTNQLFVLGNANSLEQIARIVRKIDIPLRQVLIEARVVLLDASLGRTLGVRFGGYYTKSNQSETLGLGANSTQANQLVGDTVSGPVTGNTNSTNSGFVNFPAAPINGVAAASAALALFNPTLGRLLNLEISALEAQGKGQVLSHPRVVTTDKNKAIIEQGTELPYQVIGADGVASLQFRKAILKLEVLPHITPTGDILLDLSVSKDRVGRGTTFGFAIDTKHVKTQVLVQDGGTVAIGGIYEENIQEEQAKVPLLGDIPGLGVLFRNAQRHKDKSELLVLVTPRVIATPKAGVPSVIHQE